MSSHKTDKYAMDTIEQISQSPFQPLDVRRLYHRILLANVSEMGAAHQLLRRQLNIGASQPCTKSPFVRFY